MGKRCWMKAAVLVAAATAACLAGCGGGEAPAKDDQLARETIDNLRRGNLDFVRKHFDPAQFRGQDEQELSKLHEYLNHGEPKAVTLVGWNVVKGPSGTRTALTYELAFGDSWYVVTVLVHSTDAARRVAGLHVARLVKPLAELNAFTFEGKGAVHYVMLAWAVALPLFSLAAVAVCLRTPVRRKWLWVLFLLVGFGSVSLNWTTGELQFQLFSARVLSVGCVRAGQYAPWILSVSFPLGAVVFLIRRGAVRRGAPAEPGEPDAPVALDAPTEPEAPVNSDEAETREES